MQWLLAFLPLVALGAILSATAILVGRSIRKRLPSACAFAIGAVGLAVAAVVQPVVLLVAVAALSLVRGEPAWKAIEPPATWLSLAAWTVLGVGVVTAVAGRLKTLLEVRGEVARVPSGADSRGWLALAGAGVCLASLRPLHDHLEGILLAQVQALYEGTSPVLWAKRPFPVKVPALAGAELTQIEMGIVGAKLLAAGVDRSGRISTWSAGMPGPLLVLSPLDTAMQLGGMYGGGLCGLRREGRAFCVPLLEDDHTPRELWSGPTVTAVHASWACGQSIVCVVSSDHTGTCFRMGEDGRAGSEPTVRLSGVQLVVPGFACGQCEVGLEGGVRCRVGAPGQETSGAVDGVRRAAALTASRTRACAIEEGGALHCWETGRLPPAAGPSWKARPYLEGRVIDEVAVEDEHVCARSGPRVYCWGDNTWGQLCDGTIVSNAEPREAQGITDAVAIAVAPAITCVARGGGGVFCCGKHARDGGL